MKQQESIFSFTPKPINLFALLIPITILLLSYTLIYNTHQVTTTQELIINYVNSPSQQEANELFLQSPSITHKELSHLDDVATLMNLLDLAFLLLIAITASLIIYFYRRKQTKTLAQILFLGADLTIIGITLLAVSMFTNFTKTFHLFHEVFFPQGNYAFVSTSFLITTLPGTFFQSLAMKIAITSITLAATLCAISIAIYYKSTPLPKPTK